MSDELKPCPFCGGIDQLRHSSMTGAVFCENCGCDGPWSPYFDGGWNDRTITVKQAAQVLLDEVLHEASPEAAAMRATMFSAIMRHRIPSASAIDRWHMLNHAMKAIAEGEKEALE